MSLPKPIKAAQKTFHDTLSKKFPGEIVMVRIDTDKLRFDAFHKVDKGPEWIRCADTMEIPSDILSRAVPWGGATSGGGAGGGGAAQGGGLEEDGTC